jgi:predicted TPR repeat methyltransferase
MVGDEAYTHLASVYDEIVVDPCYGRWARHMHELWDVDATPVRDVLDVGCGTGLLAAELSLLGYAMVGVDSSADMLARARGRLGDRVVLAERTLPDLSALGTFDAAVSTFDVLNYLGPAELQETMVAVADRLRPGAWFVFDLHTDAMMDFTAANSIVTGRAHGRNFTISSAVDTTGRTCETTITVVRECDGESFTEHHRQFFHSEEAVRLGLSAAGFSLIRATDEYTDEPVSASTLRATWSARLPDVPGHHV